MERNLGRKPRNIRDSTLSGLSFPPRMRSRAPQASRSGASGASKSFAFVDLQNDVTTKDIELAKREGFGASEHVKRYTTLGMGTDQGKTANVVALGVLAEITDRTIPDLGLPGFRPPYAPITWGALAGHHRGQDFRPKRLPPSHVWAIENGAVFAEAGTVAQGAMVSTA